MKKVYVALNAITETRQIEMDYEDDVSIDEIISSLYNSMALQDKATGRYYFIGGESGYFTIHSILEVV